ncbi:Tn3 family transposase [Nonomuraea sp. NPDC049695]|uniref:Tn3 family transposase n=1 Tax=Nonomuraea sp. NPDC049695 TaxID=3154734 RepID=UPI00343508EF
MVPPKVEAKALKDEPAAMLPFAPIASLLIELEARTLGCFTHAGGRKLTTSAETRRNILAVLIAMSTNVGLARMSQACGVVIVDHHYGLEPAKVIAGAHA